MFNYELVFKIFGLKNTTSSFFMRGTLKRWLSIKSLKSWFSMLKCQNSINCPTKYYYRNKSCILKQIRMWRMARSIRNELTKLTICFLCVEKSTFNYQKIKKFSLISYEIFLTRVSTEPIYSSFDFNFYLIYKFIELITWE